MRWGGRGAAAAGCQRFRGGLPPRCGPRQRASGRSQSLAGTRPAAAGDPRPGRRRRRGGPHRVRPRAGPRRDRREDRRGAVCCGGGGAGRLVRGPGAGHGRPPGDRALERGRPAGARLGTGRAGRPLPARAWMALRRLGWGAAPPDGVTVNDRIVRMAQEQAGRTLRSACWRTALTRAVTRPGPPTRPSGRRRNGTRSAPRCPAGSTCRPRSSAPAPARPPVSCTTRGGSRRT